MYNLKQVQNGVSLGEMLEEFVRAQGIDPKEPGRHRAAPGCIALDYPLDPGWFEMVLIPDSSVASESPPLPSQA